MRDVLGHGPAMGQLAAQLQIVSQPWDNVPVQFFIGTQGSITQVSNTTTLDGTPVLGGIQIPINLPKALAKRQAAGVRALISSAAKGGFEP